MEHSLAAELLDEGDLFSEAGVTGFDTGGIFDHSFSFGEEAQNGGGHGDAVISVAVDFSSHQRATTLDEKAVGFFLNRNAKETEVFSDDGEAIALFVAQLAGIPDFGGAFC